MNRATAECLLELNRRFYSEHGRDFSRTRRRLQPGVLRFIDGLHGGESILDLGCGNGELARALSRRGHTGRYLGVDSSESLLADATSISQGFRAEYQHADILELATQPEGAVQKSDRGLAASPSGDAGVLTARGQWDIVAAFAFLHHIPGSQRRMQLLGYIRNVVGVKGRFIHSNWQFLGSDRLRARIQPWSSLGLTDADVDTGDYILDWRAGGAGLRYVHHFSEMELAELAAATGFNVLETYYSDGADHRSGIYQVWQPA